MFFEHKYITNTTITTSNAIIQADENLVKSLGGNIP